MCPTMVAYWRLSLLWATISAVVSASLRHGNGIIQKTATEIPEKPEKSGSIPNPPARNRRRLVEPVRHHESFAPLRCNSEIDSTDCSTTWSSIFTNATYHDETIVVPCGQCFSMDDVPDILTLAGGLDIQGKLVIPDGVRLTMTLPYLLVQGELYMRSSKIPDGNADVTIVLTGTEDLDFVPADNNRNHCDGGAPCGIGKKPFVVAGGSIQIEALPEDTPTWVPLYDCVETDASSTSELIVDGSVSGKWAAGSEVLITSHTIEYGDQQTRRIIQTGSTDDGRVVLALDSPIARPTTVLDNPSFAVEVALLSRNIVFMGAEDDTNERHGAHLMIFHTPHVLQKLEGVEFRNFGQQGLLGRYPIHIHLSEDVSGSVVAKNLIRESNQRCIVVHGSHNLLVDSNVAYDTHGHCFMTEDGNEQGNHFVRNLGALTRRVQDLIPSTDTREETDDRPATFWMTNPTNIWEDNVAAGSEDNGYWLELHNDVRGPNAEFYEDLRPKSEPLTLFKGNVAHSNRDRGMRTYPSGYEPDQQASLLDSRFYRNRGGGLFLHNTRNVEISGGVYADNTRQIDIDRADDIVCHDATIIGVSAEYRSLREKQGTAGICQRYPSITGIELHTFRKYGDTEGATLRDIITSGFVDTGCDSASVFRFDDETRSGSFSYYPSTISSIQIEEDAARADLCLAESAGVEDISLTDIDSSLEPSSGSFTGTSTLVSDKPWMTGLIDSGKCTSVSGQCYAYCQDTCLRTVAYSVDPTYNEGHILEVCDATSPQRCIEVSSSMEYETGSNPTETTLRNTGSDKRRVFAVSVPNGMYTARFLDVNRNVDWPIFVEEFYSRAVCSDAIPDGGIDVAVPSVGQAQCSSLIRNGDADASDEHHAPWLHRHGGVELALSQGMDGSSALVDIVRNDRFRDAIGQYLDTRCIDLMVGRKYKITAWVRLVDELTGSEYDCDVNTEDCPEAGTYTLTDNGLTNKQTAALMVCSFDTSPYQLVYGVLEITEEMARQPNLFFYIQRNKSDLAMYVDNVSVQLLGDSSEETCYNLVSNGKFFTGDSRYWANNDSDRVVIVSPGIGGEDFALKTIQGTARQDIRNDLIQAGERYVAFSRFKLSAPISEHIVCSINSRNRNTRCPEMWIRHKAKDGSLASMRIAQATNPPSASDWGILYGEFVADETMAESSSIRLTFNFLQTGVDLTIDDVAIYPLRNDCDLDKLVPSTLSTFSTGSRAMAGIGILLLALIATYWLL